MPPQQQGQQEVIDTQLAALEEDLQQYPPTSFPLFIKILSTMIVFGLFPFMLSILFISSHYNHILDDIRTSAQFVHQEEKTEQSADFLVTSIKEDLDYSIRIRIGMSILAFLLVSSIGMYIVSRIIARPLKEILDGMVRLGKGEYGTTVAISSKDEFSVFAYYFNLMSRRLELLRNREQWVNKMKSNLLSLAAHQLRTPLTAIRWTIDILRREHSRSFSKDENQKLTIGEQSTRRMINLVNSLLTMTTIEEGRFDYDFKKTSFTDLVRASLRSMKLQFAAKHIEVDSDGIKKDIPDTYLDVEKMQFVLDNLLSNAMYYTPSGGRVSVSVSLREVKTAKHKQEILCLVSDTGIGMTPEEQKHLFTQFYRSPQAAKMYGEGSGLGLSITKNIIEGHGGRIWVESSPGAGTTFFFTLPVLERREEETPSRQFILGSQDSA
jgi:signal transduction histidine kinase